MPYLCAHSASLGISIIAVPIMTTRVKREKNYTPDSTDMIALIHYFKAEVGENPAISLGHSRASQLFGLIVHISGTRLA
jgi:hypothetical protein